MKETGIVRRIDELGRVVIPKEIRKTLRLKEGDLLEICVEKDGLVLKKFSSVSADLEMVKSVMENLAELTEKTVIACNSDRVVAIFNGKKDLENKNLSQELEQLLREGKSLMLSKVDKAKVLPITNDEKSVFDNEIIVPILCGETLSGGIILCSNGKENPFTNSDVKLVQLSAMLLSKKIC